MKSNVMDFTSHFFDFNRRLSAISKSEKFLAQGNCPQLRYGIVAPHRFAHIQTLSVSNALLLLDIEKKIFPEYRNLRIIYFHLYKDIILFDLSVDPLRIAARYLVKSE